MANVCEICGEKKPKIFTCAECGTRFCDECGYPDKELCMDCGGTEVEASEDSAEEELEEEESGDGETQE